MFYLYANTITIFVFACLKYNKNFLNVNYKVSGFKNNE